MVLFVMIRIKISQIGNFLCAISLGGTFLVLGGYFGSPDAKDHENLLDLFYKISAILLPSSLITFHLLSKKIMRSEGYILKGKDMTDFVNNTKIKNMIFSKTFMILAYWFVLISAGIIVPTLWFLLKSE